MGSMIQRRCMENLKFVPKARKEDDAHTRTQCEAMFALILKGSDIQESSESIPGRSLLGPRDRR
jgi:hypothetical protein